MMKIKMALSRLSFYQSGHLEIYKKNSVSHLQKLQYNLFPQPIYQRSQNFSFYIFLIENLLCQHYIRQQGKSYKIQINKTQYPLFLGTVAGTLLLYLYCDFVLLQKYCEIPNLSKAIVTFQMLSIYSMFRVNMTEPGVQIQSISEDKYFDGKLCEKCKAIKIDRCYHCKFCDHCVNDFEAHCFLMATCIGRRNIKYLLGLVTFTGIALYLLLLILIYKLFVSDCKKELTFIILNIVSLVLTLVHLNPFIYITWRNASQNWTKKEMNRTKFNGSLSYIYKNYKQFFTRVYDSQLYVSFMQY